MVLNSVLCGTGLVDGGRDGVVIANTSVVRSVTCGHRALTEFNAKKRRYQRARRYSAFCGFLIPPHTSEHWLKALERFDNQRRVARPFTPLDYCRGSLWDPGSLVLLSPDPRREASPRYGCGYGFAIADKVSAWVSGCSLLCDTAAQHGYETSVRLAGPFTKVLSAGGGCGTSVR